MTIEERAMLANPYKKEHYDSPYEINIEDKYAEGYIDGATDQQKIDIEKACEAFINYLRKEDLWKDMSNDDEFDWRIKFKQAMEE